MNGHSRDYTSVETAFVFTDVTEPLYDDVYCYDDFGMIGDAGIAGGGDCWGAALHVAKSDVDVVAVGLYLMEPNSSCQIFVYRGCTAGNLVSGRQIGCSSGTAGEYACFQTIPVSCSEKISKGERFSIVSKLTTESASQLAIEYPLVGFSSKAKASSGETFVSADGTNWDDFRNILSSSGIYNCSFCCKAYVRNDNDDKKRTFTVTFDANRGEGHHGGWNGFVLRSRLGFGRQGSLSGETHDEEGRGFAA